MSLIEESAGWDGTEMAERIAKGDVSQAEMINAAIARAEKVNPELNAIAFECFDRARNAPAPNGGPFAGVPTTIKDNDNIDGLPTRNGSLAEPGHPAVGNSPFVDQISSAGLIPIAKTTLPEYGLTATTESLLHGATRNPWNTNHSTGGSSGGSAALGAARVAPVVHANDGGGSIRIPASNCGLVGLKSTRDRLAPMLNTDNLPVNIVTEGILTHTVRDTAAFFAHAEQNRPTPHLPPIGHVKSASPMRLRIGYFTASPNGDSADEEVIKAVHETARILESLGHQVEEIANPVGPELTDDFLTYWALIPVFLKLLGKRTVHPDYDASQFTIWAKGLQGYFWRRFWKLPGVIKRMKAFGTEQDEAMGVYDLHLTPVLGSPAVEIGYLGPDVPFDEAMERLLPYAAFTAAQNGSGQPGINLPLAMSEKGLPIGMHFTSRTGTERMLLELAYELEEATPWRNRKPVICA